MPKKTPKPLSVEVREARAVLDITQDEAARRAGIGGKKYAGQQAAWSAVETGRLDRKHAKIQEIRRAVGLE